MLTFYTDLMQRQQERRKRDQQNKNRQRGRGDDAQPTTMPETLYAVERNNSARLANAPQAPVQIQQRPSTAPPAIGTDNHQAAQLLRASLQKNKKQANVDTDIPDSVMDGPEPKLSRLNGADTCVTSGVVSTPDDPMVLQSSSESVSFSSMSLNSVIRSRRFTSFVPCMRSTSSHT